jgi:hypothetical protein
MGVIRVWNTEHQNWYTTALTITSVVSSIFQHRVGMVFNTIQDILIEIQVIQRQDDWERVLKSLIKIANDLIT